MRNEPNFEGRTVLAFATQGAGGDDEDRLRGLLAGVGPGVTFFPFDRSAKPRSARALLQTLRRTKPDLVVMEGTGWTGGLAVMAGRRLAGVPYVVSSGDAVGPFIAAKIPAAGPAFHAYEKRLCRDAAGFIGWTPYLAGRALTFGTPRVMTAAGWAPFDPPADRDAARAEVRARLGIPADALVVGIVGSLAWNARAGYCYGKELVEAVSKVDRPDVAAVVVGDGAGLDRLRALAGDRLGRSVFLPGRVPRDEVPRVLSALDLASLPQSVDGVGSFRYTTKLSEYLAAGLPVVTGQIPLAYDLDSGWLWRLPGPSPWDPVYVDALADLLARLTPAEVAGRRAAVPAAPPEFDQARQVARVAAFLGDILAGRAERTQFRGPSGGIGLGPGPVHSA